MSMTVNDSRPYTDEEKDYLRTRAFGEDQIAINDRKFAHLSDAQKRKLQGQFEKDQAGEEELQRRFAEQDRLEEEDSYHVDDIDYVKDMTIAELRQNLEKRGLRHTVRESDKDPDADGDDPLTEKQVLSLRLLDHLDEIRDANNAALQGSAAPEPAPTTGAGVVNTKNPGVDLPEEDAETEGE